MIPTPLRSMLKHVDFFLKLKTKTPNLGLRGNARKTLWTKYLAKLSAAGEPKMAQKNQGRLAISSNAWVLRESKLRCLGKGALATVSSAELIFASLLYAEAGPAYALIWCI